MLIIITVIEAIILGLPSTLRNRINLSILTIESLTL